MDIKRIKVSDEIHRPFNGKESHGESVRNLIKASLIRNVSQFHFLNNTETKRIIDTFMKESVTIDTHKIGLVRTNNKVSSINPITNNTTTNGMSRNIRNRHGDVFGKDNVFMPIYVYNYAPPLPPTHQPTPNNGSNIHKNHTIAAFKSGNVLYCFNPWGGKYILNNQRTGQILPDNLIWEHLRQLYKCDEMFVYTGTNFQKLNTRGICVALGIEFGSHMYNYLLMKQLSHGTMPYLNFNKFEKRGNMIYSHQYNNFINFLFGTFVGALANGRSCSLQQYTNELTGRLNSYRQPTQKNELNQNRRRKMPTAGFMKDVNTLFLNDSNFRHAMNMSNWLAKNSTDKMVTYRTKVRERIRTTFNKYNNMYWNTMNKMLKQYQQQKQNVTNIVKMMNSLHIK